MLLLLFCGLFTALCYPLCYFLVRRYYRAEIDSLRRKLRSSESDRYLFAARTYTALCAAQLQRATAEKAQYELGLADGKALTEMRFRRGDFQA